MTHQLEMSGGGLRPARPRILALDLALTSVGYCLDGEPGFIQSKLKGYDRISEIYHEIMRMTFGVHLVVIEDVIYGKNYPGTVARHKLAGAIELALYEHRIPTVLLNPSTLKLFATGNGKSQKIHMARAAWHRFHLGDCHTNDDEIDAYLLWCAAREAYGGSIAKVPARQAACIHRLDWPKIRTRSAA